MSITVFGINVTPRAIVQGVVTVFACIFVASVIMAAIAYVSPGDVGQNSVASIALTFMPYGALFVGGWVAGRKSFGAGWFHGLITGFIYVIAVFILFQKPGATPTGVLAAVTGKIALATVVALLGGIAGVKS